MNRDKSILLDNNCYEDGTISIFLPSTLDIQALVKQFPTVIRSSKSNSKDEQIVSVKPETLMWIVGTVIYFRYLKEDQTHPWIGISSKYFKNKAYNYRDHLSWLLLHDVLQENPRYSNRNGAGFSKSFALHTRFREDDIIEHRIKRRLKRHVAEQDDVSKHLNMNISDPRLHVDFRTASARAVNLTVEQRNGWKITENAYRRRAQGKRDTTSSRFHSHVTQTPKYMRSYVTYEGQHLVSIDIVNSQPYFLSLFIQQIISNGKKEGSMNKVYSKNIYNINNEHLPLSSSSHRVSQYVAMECSAWYSAQIHTIDSDPESSISLSGSPDYSKVHLHSTSISSICGNEMPSEQERAWNRTGPMNNNSYEQLTTSPLSGYIPEDISRFIESNRNGNFYESLAELWHCAREEAKSKFMVILFGRNTYTSSEEKAFSHRFPNIYQIILDQKVNGHNQLAILLQSLESELMIDHVCRFLMEHHAHIPIFTVHDSILTVPRYTRLVESVITQQFYKWYGCAPVLKTEQWKAESEKTDDLAGVELQDKGPNVQSNEEAREVNDPDTVQTHEQLLLTPHSLDELISMIHSVVSQIQDPEGASIFHGYKIKSKEGLYEFISRIRENMNGNFSFEERAKMYPQYVKLRHELVKLYIRDMAGEITEAQLEAETTLCVSNTAWIEGFKRAHGLKL